MLEKSAYGGWPTLAPVFGAGWDVRVAILGKSGMESVVRPRAQNSPLLVNYPGPQGEVLMGDVAYTSKVRIERKQGPLRIAYLPGEKQPVAFSVHGAIAERYKIDPATLTESHAATIDYVIAATAG